MAIPSERARRRGVRVTRRFLLAFGVALVVTGVLSFVTSARYDRATKDWPVDFDLNQVAARRLVDRQPLYDRVAARREGMRIIGQQMRFTGRDTYSSYIGSPVVALAQVPFLRADPVAAAQLYRFVSFLAMIASILLTTGALAPRARAPAALIVLGVFFWSFPMVKAMSLGQGSGLVMFGLALGIWGAARQRWTVAGVGLGFATALKLSPVLLLAYLLLRGKRRVVGSAVVTAASLCALAAMIGRPVDLWIWLRDVTPGASRGTLGAYNQSVVGALARLTTGQADLGLRAGTGAWYLLAYALWGIALVGLWRRRRHRPVDPLELGILMIVLLLAGPLTWDHYFVWALLPLVLLLDPARWAGRSRAQSTALIGALVVATALQRFAIPVPSPADVQSHWWVRVLPDRYVVSALLLLVVAIALLRTPASDDEGSECGDGGRDAVGTARELVAAGVHERG